MKITIETNQPPSPSRVGKTYRGMLCISDEARHDRLDGWTLIEHWVSFRNGNPALYQELESSPFEDVIG